MPIAAAERVGLGVCGRLVMTPARYLDVVASWPIPGNRAATDHGKALLRLAHHVTKRVPKRMHLACA